MKQELRDKLFHALMRIPPGQPNFAPLEQMVADDVRIIEPIIDEYVDGMLNEICVAINARIHDDEGNRLSMEQKKENIISNAKSGWLAYMRERSKYADTTMKRVVDRLEKVASQCEAGGHTSRGKMLRALAAEFRA
jgi:hypothetical protein